MHYSIKHQQDLFDRRYPSDVRNHFNFDISSNEEIAKEQCRKLIADNNHNEILPVVVLPEPEVQNELAITANYRTNFSAIIFEYSLVPELRAQDAERIFILVNRKEYTDIVGYVHLKKLKFDFWYIKNADIFSPFKEKGFLIDLLVNIIRFDYKITNHAVLKIKQTAPIYNEIQEPPDSYFPYPLNNVDLINLNDFPSRLLPIEYYVEDDNDSTILDEEIDNDDSRKYDIDNPNKLIEIRTIWDDLLKFNDLLEVVTLNYDTNNISAYDEYLDVNILNVIKNDINIDPLPFESKIFFLAKAKQLNNGWSSRIISNGAILPSAVEIIKSAEFIRWIYGYDDEWNVTTAINTVNDISKATFIHQYETEPRTEIDGSHIHGYTGSVAVDLSLTTNIEFEGELTGTTLESGSHQHLVSLQGITYDSQNSQILPGSEIFNQLHTHDLAGTVSGSVVIPISMTNTSHTVNFSINESPSISEHSHKLSFNHEALDILIEETTNLLENIPPKKWLLGDELNWSNQLSWNFTQLFSVRYGNADIRDPITNLIIKPGQK